MIYVDTKKVLTKEERRKRDSCYKITNVPLNKLHDNPNQQRNKYSVKGIKELAGNISERGLLQPVVVAGAGKKGYILIAGHRRTRAFRRLNRENIPAIVKVQTTAQDMVIDLAVENALRQDLLPIEKARSYFNVLCLIKNVKNAHSRAFALVGQVKLHERRGNSTDYNTKGNTAGFTMEDIYECGRLLKLIGTSPNSCVTHLRLLTLPPPIQDKIVAISDNHKQQAEALEKGKIPIVLGYELSRINNEQVQTQLYNKIVRKKLSSVVVRGIVDQMLEEGIVRQCNKLGTSRRKSPKDYGLENLIDRTNAFASTLWNFRKKYPKINMMLDRLFFKSALRRLRKSAEALIASMDPYFEDEEDWLLNRFKNKKLTVVIRPGVGGQKFRFSFPSRYGQELGLGAGDSIVFSIDSIKKAKQKKL